ncbi:NAD(P)H-binding protein [Nocardia sp. NBC_00508]|uniref:SDR family oxidoreductase n=1 Tax=Nocardia sp. NBC_00508 TaxID=2975992 RepID=UPI002E819933|nr:NAD(P)H-binding protein [Nocardia sp. NBC_00508]WUD68730.1 NAD(P)H-binding protein [Nocardia sp. NBC_00508]
MDKSILVTGGTGALGRVVVARLIDAGQATRVMSRHSRPSADAAPYEWAIADLESGEGVDAALTGVGAVVHCATTTNGKKDLAAARTLVDAARRAGSPHLVYVSIVGVDKISLPYYRGKLAAERMIEESGLPYTILRATQFHDLLRVIFAGAAKLPVIFVPSFRFQPIDVGEVAGRLVELATGSPVGHAPDIGGPQVRDARDLAGAYVRAAGLRRKITPIRLPGKIFRAFRQGGNLALEHADGRVTFEEYLAAHVDARSLSYRGQQ